MGNVVGSKVIIGEIIGALGCDTGNVAIDCSTNDSTGVKKKGMVGL